jgi:K+-transporting ATPase KdpF subunit
MSRFATTREEDAVMTLDLWLAAITALGLLLYLVAVLVRPERF